MLNYLLYILLLTTALVLDFAGSYLKVMPIMLLIILYSYEYLSISKKQYQTDANYAKIAENNVIKRNENHIKIKSLKQPKIFGHLRSKDLFIDKIKSHISDEENFTIMFLKIESTKSFIDDENRRSINHVLYCIEQHFNINNSDNLLISRFDTDVLAFLYNKTGEKNVNIMAEKIKQTALSITKDYKNLKINVKIGVARYPQNGQDYKTLFILASKAMDYKQKPLAIDYCIAPQNIKQKEKKINKMISLLENIDIEKDLSIEYQPRFSFKNDEIIGLEALLRWNHETIGQISPRDFIPIAENLEVIDDMTRWIIKTGMREVAKWNTTYNLDLKLSINLARLSMQKSNFFEFLKSELLDANCKPEWIIVEFTEEILTKEPLYMKTLLDSITNLGIKVHLDDYGVNRTSLSSLKKFNITSLKIDNDLVAGVGLDDDKEDIIRSIIYLANGLGLKASAEGVETKIQYEFLKKHGCYTYQGFYKDKPLKSLNFEQKYLAKRAMG